MLVTSKLLRKRGACDEEVALFDQEWPEGVTTSEAGLLRASEIGLDLTRFVQKFLKAPFRKEFNRQVAPFREKFNRQEAPFAEEYDRQVAPFVEEYYRQVALLLWSLFEKQEKGVKPC